MRDAGTMRAIERIADLNRRSPAPRPPAAHRIAPDAIGQRLAFEELEDEVVEIAVASDVVDRADVRIVERGDGARFLFEAPARFRVRRERAGQHLHRHGPIEPRITGAIDLAHAACAERRDDLVRTETGAGLERHATVRPAPLPEFRPQAPAD